MKKITKNFKFAAMMLLLAGVMISCGKENNANEDNYFWNISPNSPTTSIVNSVDGIEFTFCLMDSTQNPSTHFKEGEPFTIYFAMKNCSNDSLIFFVGLPCDLTNHGLGDIFHSGDNRLVIDFGVPCLLSMGYYPFPLNKEYQFIPSDAHSGNTQIMLPKGKYTAKIIHTFEFLLNKDQFINENNLIYFGTITFKIDFEIY
ncbi:MAG: hypothetical protein LBK94_01920 [Prevotellaceae bacterium]|jgi:hypothetical protein|nr:hypothetical protein [Prevotellaceae bacterium]